MEWNNIYPRKPSDIIQVVYYENGNLCIGVENNFNNTDFSSVLKYLGFNLNKKGDYYYIHPDKEYENFVIACENLIYKKIAGMSEECRGWIECELGYFIIGNRKKLAKAVAIQQFSTIRKVFDIITTA